MVLLWAVVIGVLAGFLRRGSLAHLARLRLRGLWLIVMTLVIQLLIFPLGSAGPLVTVGTTWLHLTSYLFLLVFTGLNRRYPEILVMGAGLLLNLIAIAANGGYMPVSAEALRQAGLAGVAAALEQGTRQGNTVLMGPKTRLNFLGDFIYLPAAVPLSSAFSIGDVVLAVGFVLLLARRMVRPRAGHGSPPPPNTNPDHRQVQGPP